MGMTLMKIRFKTNLFPEQTVFGALTVLLVLVAIGWELPSRNRVELLRAGIQLTDADRQALISVSESYYARLDTAQRSAASDLISKGKTKIVDMRNNIGWFYTNADKMVAFRSYINGSGAVDERKAFSALSRMRPSRLDFDPKLYIYGGSYLYPLGALLFVLKSLGVLHVTNDISAYLDHPRDMALLYLTGRLISVLAFAGAIWLLGILGNRMGGRLTGLAAMMTFGLSSVALNYSVITKPHVYAAFFGLLGVYGLVRFRETGGNKWLAWATMAIGWAFGASFAAGALGLLFPCCLYDKGRIKRSSLQILAAWAGIGAVFILTNPYFILSWDQYALTLYSHSSPDGWGYGVTKAGKLLGYLRRVFQQGYCFPVSLFGIIGLVWAIWKGEDWTRRLALATALLLFLLGMSLANLRISLFGGALFCLYCGYGLSLFLRSVSGQRWVRGCLLGAAFLQPLLFAAVFFRDTIFDEHWMKPAREWIQRRPLREGVSVGFLESPSPLDAPALPFLRMRMINLAAYSGTQEPPDYVVIGNYGYSRPAWENHPLRNRYVLDADLGYRPSFDWRLKWRIPNESRICGWVFRRADQRPQNSH